MISNTLGNGYDLSNCSVPMYDFATVTAGPYFIIKGVTIVNAIGISFGASNFNSKIYHML